MPSYTSLLVIALTASAVSPVRCAEPLKIEDRGHSPSQASSIEKRQLRFGKTAWALAFTALMVVLGVTVSASSKKHNAAPTPPSTNSAQQNYQRRDFVARQEGARDHSGLPVDTATGSSEVISVNNQDRHTSSSPDLLRRADLDEALILLSRKLDKLD